MITSGKHNNVAGTMLIVSTLTQACGNFDPRRAAGNQVLLFSCGGRADGGEFYFAHTLSSYSIHPGVRSLIDLQAAKLPTPQLFAFSGRGWLLLLSSPRTRKDPASLSRAT